MNFIKRLLKKNVNFVNKESYKKKNLPQFLIIVKKMGDIPTFSPTSRENYYFFFLIIILLLLIFAIFFLDKIMEVIAFFFSIFV